MNTSSLVPGRLPIAAIPQVIAQGWQLFRNTPIPSLAFSSLSVCMGYGLLAMAVELGLSPLSLPLAGGFMLLAPAMLGGFFQIVKSSQEGEKNRLSTPFTGFVRAPLQLWVIAVFCSFIFLIWMTDAGVLYSLTLGGEARETAWLWFTLADRSVVAFWFWGSLMGGFLAFVIYCVTAFSIPLLFERRTTLIQAVHASIRAVFANFLTCMAWAITLSLLTLTAVLLLPLLLIMLPVLAYASFLLYQWVFPLNEASGYRSPEST